MASKLRLSIPPCTLNPSHQNHFPTLDKPLRVQIEGPLTAIQKLLGDVEWSLTIANRKISTAGSRRTSSLDISSDIRTWQSSGNFEWCRGTGRIFGLGGGKTPRRVLSLQHHLRVGAGRFGVVVTYFFFLQTGRIIDYYGVTFDHLVGEHETNPEVLQINIFEMDDDNGD